MTAGAAQAGDRGKSRLGHPQPPQLLPVSGTVGGMQLTLGTKIVLGEREKL